MIQRRLVKGGLSKQTAKGSPAAAATYAFGVRSGSVFKHDVVENPLGMTWGNRSIQGFDRQLVKPSSEFEVVATPALMGLLLLGVFGADAVTGAGPYTHTITPAADLNYLTAWGTFGTADWGKIADCKVSSLELAFDLAGKVTAKAVIPGLTPSFLAAVYTETNQELIATVGILAAAGGLFQVEGAAANIQSGSIKFDNKVEQPGIAATVTPADVVPAQWEVTYSLKIVPNDTGLFREVVFGSSAGGAQAAVANSPHLGSIECKFIGTIGTASLDVLSSAVRFAVAFPEANPAGGPTEITLEGTATLPASGSDTTATMVNSVASY
jgi:hypothetical protein